MFFVRQGATHKLLIGPVVAVANGYVPVTTLDLSTADEKAAVLHDNGTVVSISAYTFAAVTGADGYYHLTLQSGITNTVGHVTIVINDDSLCLPVKAEYTVIDTVAYDALFADGATGAFTGVALAADQAVNVTKFGGTTVTGRDIGASVLLSSGTGTGQLSLSSGLVTLAGVTHTGAVIPTVTTTTTATNLTNERGKYADGAVWIGPTANTNTTNYTDGIITNPVSTIAAAKTIADSLGLRRFHITRTGAASIGADMVGYDFSGSNWTLTTTGGSRDVSGSHFADANVIGGTYASTTASSNWDQCEFATGVSVAAVNMHHCTFAGTLTLNAAGNYDFIDCASIVAGSSAPVFAIPAGTVNVSFRRWSGGIEISGITSGTTISLDVVSGGTVTLKGADGTVNVRGMVNTIDDQRTGTPTLGQTAAINRTVLATPTNITAGTITTVSGNVNGSVASVTGAVGSVTAEVDVGKINGTTITGNGSPGTEFGV